jgi:hypothetical protein
MAGRLLRVPAYARALSDAVDCMRIENVTFWHFVKTDYQRARHFALLKRRLSRILPRTLPKNIVSNFHGPWLEDRWIAMQRSRLSVFGHFIPLFVPWNRLWLLNGRRARGKVYRQYLRSIFHCLSTHFLYVTVSQNSDGIEGENVPFLIPSNLFVLSQGGKGHIPLLLWLEQLNPSQYSLRKRYEFDALFMGNLGNHMLRSQMVKIMQKVFPNSSFFSYARKDWTNQYKKAKLILCPRGWGRNSYRFGEVLQMGMIPVYVYSDLIWLPYYDSIDWRSFSYIAHIDQLEDVLERAKRELTTQKVLAMRKKIRRLYYSHWTPKGVIHQIMLLLRTGFRGSDLRCARYSHVRDEYAT